MFATCIIFPGEYIIGIYEFILIALFYLNSSYNELLVCTDYKRELYGENFVNKLLTYLFWSNDSINWLFWLSIVFYIDNKLFYYYN